MSDTPAAEVLIGPRRLDDRICRLMYVRETDEAWTEEWAENTWCKSNVLVRHLMGAPVASRAVLKRRGIATDLGAWERQRACA